MLLLNGIVVLNKKRIDFYHNKLKLINIDELQFKIKINEIYNKRKTVLV